MTMKSDDEEAKMHQLHIAIPAELQEDLKKILPEWGAVTSLVRNFLQGYVRNFNKMAPVTKSPFDKTVDDMVGKALLKRNLGGDDGATGD